MFPAQVRRRIVSESKAHLFSRAFSAQWPSKHAGATRLTQTDPRTLGANDGKDRPEWKQTALPTPTQLIHTILSQAKTKKRYVAGHGRRVLWRQTWPCAASIEAAVVNAQTALSGDEDALASQSLFRCLVEWPVWKHCWGVASMLGKDVRVQSRRVLACSHEDFVRAVPVLAVSQNLEEVLHQLR